MSTTSCARIDDTFGPYAQHCRGGFDFTLFFEETILSILPLALILAVAPFRIYYLFRRSIKVNHSILLASKVVRAPRRLRLWNEPDPFKILSNGR